MLTISSFLVIDDNTVEIERVQLKKKGNNNNKLLEQQEISIEK
jgi:hypothetical protein